MLHMMTTAFFDPAARSGQQHDFKAIVLGSLVNRLFYVRYAFIRRCSVQAVLDELYVIHARFPDARLACEVNGFQILYKDLLEYKSEKMGFRLHIDAITSTGNKAAGIESLSGYIETGAILFEKDQDGYTSDIPILLEQLLEFPHGKHDDGPDALYHAHLLARQRARGLNTRNMHAGGARGAAALHTNYTNFNGFL